MITTNTLFLCQLNSCIIFPNKWIPIRIGNLLEFRWWNKNKVHRRFIQSIIIVWIGSRMQLHKWWSQVNGQYTRAKITDSEFSYSDKTMAFLNFFSWFRFQNHSIFNKLLFRWSTMESHQKVEMKMLRRHFEWNHSTHKRWQMCILCRFVCFGNLSNGSLISTPPFTKSLSHLCID